MSADDGYVTKPTSDWSPADHSSAIAVSQAQLWSSAVRLAVHRLHGDDDKCILRVSSRQLDAIHLVVALSQLLVAERLEQVALKDRCIGPPVSSALCNARERFEEVLPGISLMRNALMHFDEWSRGEGHPHKQRVKKGMAPRDVAREEWTFCYSPNAGAVTLGPYSINVDAANQAAHQLFGAIYLAALEVDKREHR